MAKFRWIMWVWIIGLLLVGNGGVYAVPVDKPSAAKLDGGSDKIQLIQIVGNKRISTTSIGAASALVVGNLATPGAISRAVRNIQAMGLFQTVESRIDSVKGGKNVVITVVENPVIGPIQFAGATAFPSHNVTLNLTSGAVMDLAQLRKDVTDIESWYQDSGYRWAKVVGVRTPKSDGDPLVYQISEGTLSQVVITGNLKTRDYVILREMTLKPGMPLHEGMLRRDLRRIYNLNFFTVIEPDLQPGAAPNSYRLILRMVDKPAGSANLGGSISDKTGLVGFIDLNLANLDGTAQELGLKFQYGFDPNIQSATYEIRYFNPWMWESRRSLLVQLWKKTGYQNVYFSGNNASVRQERLGGQVGVGIPLGEDSRITHTVRVENITNLETLRQYDIKSWAIGLTFDSRDVWFNPTEGAFNQYYVEKAFPISERSLNYVKVKTSFVRFWPVVPDRKQVLGANLDYGVLVGELEDTELFEVGSGTTVRGYDVPFATGKNMGLLNLEYRYLFSDQFQMVGFVDIGQATADTFGSGGITDFTRWQVGKGIGFRFTIPLLGAIRLDFANGNNPDWRIHFGIGHMF